MNANEYQALAMRTAAGSREKGDLNALVVMALGLAGETAELLESNTDVQKELGDCWWYVAVLAELMDVKLDEFVRTSGVNAERHTDFIHRDLVVSAGKICDYVKKVFGHGHPLEQGRVIVMLDSYVISLIDKTYQHGNPSWVWEANIEKLKKRYPNGFSSEASINRKE